MNWTFDARHSMRDPETGIAGRAAMARSSRLRKSDWLDAGLAALAKDGPDALKAEPLARALDTTKGSFYWHFADVPAFHAALIAHWTGGANSALFDAAEQAETHTAALRGMAQQIAAPAPRDPFARAEPAMRAWAASHKGAAKAIASVDAERMQVIAALLDRIGVSNREIAQLILAAANGLPKKVTGDPMGTLVDLVLALR